MFVVTLDSLFYLIDLFDLFVAYQKITSLHCVKSVHIRIFFWSIFSSIRIEYRKIRTRENSVFGHFSRSVVLCSSLVLLTSKVSKFVVFPGTYFLIFDTQNIHIQSKYRKIRIRKKLEYV